MERVSHGVGATLSENFSIYGSQAGAPLPVAFCLFIVVAIVNGVLAGNVALFPIAMAVGVIAASLYQGMVVNLASDVQDGRRDSSVGDLVRSTAPVVGPLILAVFWQASGLASDSCCSVGTRPDSDDHRVDRPGDRRGEARGAGRVGRSRKSSSAATGGRSFGDR